MATVLLGRWYDIRDLSNPAAKLRDIIDWILEAARPLVAMYPASDPT